MPVKWCSDSCLTQHRHMLALINEEALSSSSSSSPAPLFHGASAESASAWGHSIDALCFFCRLRSFFFRVWNVMLCVRNVMDYQKSSLEIAESQWGVSTGPDHRPSSRFSLSHPHKHACRLLSQQLDLSISWLLLVNKAWRVSVNISDTLQIRCWVQKENAHQSPEDLRGSRLFWVNCSFSIKPTFMRMLLDLRVREVVNTCFYLWQNKPSDWLWIKWCLAVSHEKHC